MEWREIAFLVFCGLVPCVAIVVLGILDMRLQEAVNKYGESVIGELSEINFGNMIKNHGVVVLIKNDKKFLLIKDSRELMLNLWAPPHGRCNKTDRNEKDAVIRETFEETGLQVHPVKKIWTTDADTKVKTVSFWLAEVIGGEIRLDEKESSEYGWFTLEEALGLQLYPGTKKFFVLLKQGDITV